jgi:hypothetical protein
MSVLYLLGPSCIEMAPNEFQQAFVDVWSRAGVASSEKICLGGRDYLIRRNYLTLNCSVGDHVFAAATFKCYTCAESTMPRLPLAVEINLLMSLDSTVTATSLPYHKAFLRAAMDYGQSSVGMARHTARLLAGVEDRMEDFVRANVEHPELSAVDVLQKAVPGTFLSYAAWTSDCTWNETFYYFPPPAPPLSNSASDMPTDVTFDWRLMSGNS